MHNKLLNKNQPPGYKTPAPAGTVQAAAIPDHRPQTIHQLKQLMGMNNKHPFSFTVQPKANVNINDDKSLETEADIMGGKAMSPNTAVQPVQQQVARGHAIQRKITVGKDKYSDIDENMDDLKLALDRDLEFSESELKKKGVSVSQVLTRFDHQNRSFKDLKALILAIRSELKNDLGEQDESVNALLPVHPLENDDNEGGPPTPMLALLKEKDPKGNVRNLILEDTEAAKEVMKVYRESRRHPESDTVLFKSMLATIELHQSGSTAHGHYTKKENELLEYVLDAYNEETVNKMISEYGLNKIEHNSIIAYSFPNKDKIFVNGAWNQYYMGYSKGNWGNYGDGWTALASAMKKLPNLGQLGLNITSYRASRNSEESDQLNKLKPGATVKHGKNILAQGQQHYTSAALTYNVHNTPQRVGKAKGLMAIHGGSGVLINPFGGQGFLDGAEILFPPNMYTQLVKKKDNAFTTPKFKAPVYHLQEIAAHTAGQHVVDDFKFKKLKSQYDEQQERTNEQILALTDQIQQSAQILQSGKKLDLSSHEKTVEHLTVVRNRLFDIIEQRQGNQAVVNNYKKLVLINQLRSIPSAEDINKFLTEKKDKAGQVITPGKGFWDESVETLESLTRFYKLN